MKKRRLTINTHRDARRELNKIMRQRLNDEMESEKYKDLRAGFDTMHKYFKLEADLGIEARLEVIEERLDQEEANR